MTIHPGDLRDGTVVEYQDGDGLNIRPVYVNGEGFSHYKSGARFGPALVMDDAESITRVFVAVPDGVSVADAERALADITPDPDAELVELIAHGIVSAAVGEGQWERLQDSTDWLIAARRALALVRESEAGA